MIEYDVNHSSEICHFGKISEDLKHKTASYVERVLYINEIQHLVNIKHKDYFISSDIKYVFNAQSLKEPTNDKIDNKLMSEGKKCLEFNAPKYQAEHVIINSKN